MHAADPLGMERYLPKPASAYADERAIIDELVQLLEQRDREILRLHGNALFARHELGTLRKLAIAADDHLRREAS